MDLPSSANGTRRMQKLLRPVRRLIGVTLRDLAPLALVVVFFQLVVIGRPFPDLADLLIGTLFVIVGLMLFVRGLEMGLFPLGEAMAGAFARRGSLPALLAFGFALGFSTTVAEPALIAVAGEGAAAAAQSGLITDDTAAVDGFAYGLRLTVAVSVGFALVLGVLRIVRGWPVHVLVIGGYLAVASMTALAPPEIVGIAYDSGGVTTSTVTVPLVTALGVGLAGTIRGRNPLIDGFGMIALASLTPILFVLAFGLLWGRG
jgi:hypothetical protein